MKLTNFHWFFFGSQPPTKSIKDQQEAELIEDWTDQEYLELRAHYEDTVSNISGEQIWALQSILYFQSLTEAKRLQIEQYLRGQDF